MSRDKLAAKAVLAGLSLLVILPLWGCGDSNRVPSQAEIKAADANRQAFIDNNPNLTPEQKAIMKSHMGGPAVPDPSAAARSQANQNARGRR